VALELTVESAIPSAASKRVSDAMRTAGGYSTTARSAITDLGSIVCDVQRRARLNWLVAAAVTGLAVVAVADGLRSGRASPTRAAPTTEPATRFTPPLAPKQEIERVGSRWAALFARGIDDCSHMIQPLCERIACTRPGGREIRNCKPPTSGFRRSFKEAVVQEIAFKGRRRARARFSNGEVVDFEAVRDTWWMRNLGAEAKD